MLFRVILLPSAKKKFNLRGKKTRAFSPIKSKSIIVILDWLNDKTDSSEPTEDIKLLLFLVLEKLHSDIVARENVKIDLNFKKLLNRELIKLKLTLLNWLLI